MHPSELDHFRELLLDFKQEIHRDLEKVTKQIESLSQKVEKYQENNNEIKEVFGRFQERQDQLRKDVDNNFSQHSEFYDKINKLNPTQIEANKTKAEINENDVIRIKTTARNFYIFFGALITILGAVISLLEYLK